MTNVRGILKVLLYPVYLVACGEIIMRVISGFSVIPDIELLRYAKEMVRPSAVPGLAVEPVPGASAVLMGHRLTLNESGYRSPPLTRPKPASERRVYFMGTSIALGWGVGQNETFAAVAQRLLTENLAPRTKRTYVAVNAGVANYNVLNEVTLFKRDREATRPDAVVMQYFPRDAEPNQERRDNAIVKASYLAAFVYRRLQGLFTTGGESAAEHFKKLHREDNPDWRRTRGAILEMRDLAHRDGTAFAVVLIPDLRDPSPMGPFAPVYESVKAFLAGAKIDVIDPRGLVTRLLGDDPSKGWVHPADPHPNAAVHQAIGRAIYDYLAGREGLL
jgi:hypothetical protein